MDVDSFALRRAGYALVAVCLLAPDVGCSPVSWGVNEATKLIHHHSSNAAPTKALEAATAPDANKTPA